MNFQPHLAELVMAGGKTCTRRLVSDNPRSPWWRERCGYQPGKIFTVNPGRGKMNIGRARVISADRQPLGWLPPAEAVREGFATLHEFEQAWKAINGSYDLGALVWRVEFEVVRPLDADEWFGDGTHHPARIAGIA